MCNVPLSILGLDKLVSVSTRAELGQPPIAGTLEGRLALFFSKKGMQTEAFYLRQVCVHNRTMEPAQVSSEHAMLHSLLLDDALASLPRSIQPAAHAAHLAAPFESTTTLREGVRALKAERNALAERMWAALLSNQPMDVQELSEGITSAQLSMVAKWRKSMPTAEGDVPYGETLLHAAASAGSYNLAHTLLAAGASPTRRGIESGATPLHAAAAAGHVGLVKLLLHASRGVNGDRGLHGAVMMQTYTSRHTALHLACAALHQEVARELVTAGADPHSSCPGGSPISTLRKLGSQAALQLILELDWLTADTPQIAEAASTAEKGEDAGPHSRATHSVQAASSVSAIQKDRESESDDEEDEASSDVDEEGSEANSDIDLFEEEEPDPW